MNPGLAAPLEGAWNPGLAAPLEGAWNPGLAAPLEGAWSPGFGVRRGWAPLLRSLDECERC